MSRIVWQLTADDYELIFSHYRKRIDFNVESAFDVLKITNWTLNLSTFDKIIIELIKFNWSSV